MPVADKDALAVDNLSMFTRIGRRSTVHYRRIWQLRRKRLRQLARRVDRTQEHVGSGVTALLTGVPELHHGGYIVKPRHRHGRAGLKQHHRFGIGSRDAGDQFVLSSDQLHIGAVVALGFPFAAKTDADDRYVRVGG